VLLDFHQDAFSKEIGQDGAPRWVLDLLLGPNGYPYLGGPLTDLGARRFAPHTLEAFRRFNANEQDVQVRFASAAAVVASRFKKSRAVVGYEIMNEPLANPDATGEAQLLALHTRVTPRSAPSTRSTSSRSSRTRCGTVLNPAPLPAAPFPDPKTLYAPHIYTYVFDGQTFTGDRTALASSMQHAATEASAWGSALFVGEYGIDPTHPLANEWITASLDLQDQFRAHSTFWLWEEISSGHWGLFEGESSDPAGQRPERQRALSRPYARVVPGYVVEHTVDPTSSRLRVLWEGTARGAAEIYVPPLRFPNGAVVTCDGSVVNARPDEKTHVVTMRCGRTGRHIVEVAPAS
jgi:hypothetical protein